MKGSCQRYSSLKDNDDDDDDNGEIVVSLPSAIALLSLADWYMAFNVIITVYRSQTSLKQHL